MTVAWDVSPTTVTVLEDGGLINVTPSQTTVTSGNGSAMTHIWWEVRTNDLLLSNGIDSAVFGGKLLDAGSYYIDATLTLGSGALSTGGVTFYSADIRISVPGITPIAVVCASSANHAAQNPAICGVSLNAFLILTVPTTVYLTCNSSSANRYARFTNYAGTEGATSWRISKLT